MSVSLNRTIHVFNPYAWAIRQAGADRIVRETDRFDPPFLHLLGARWLYAQEQDQTRLTHTIIEVDRQSVHPIVLPDFFLSELISQFGDRRALQLYDGGIFVFSSLPELADLAGVTPVGMNPFMSGRSGPIDRGTGFHYASFSETSAAQVPIVPMGCPQEWLPQVDHYEKAIFLDEPHFSILENLRKGDDDITVKLLKHAMETCRLLSRRGFRIRSFSRVGSKRLASLYRKYDFVEVISVGSWIPFHDLVRYYSECSLFFSFFTETHGYPIYENMQLGNGIVTYAETFDAYRLRPMQRGVLLSVYNKPTTCARLIEEYFDRYVSRQLRPLIRQDAFESYSADTFFPRLRTSTAFRSR
jgi:hypothetical protein